MKKKVIVHGGIREKSVDPAISELVAALMDAWINVDAKYSKKYQLISLLFKNVNEFKQFCLMLREHGDFDPLDRLANSLNCNESISNEASWFSQLIVGTVDGEFVLGVDLQFPSDDMKEVTQALHENNKRYIKTKKIITEKPVSNNQVECDWLKKVCDDIKQESFIPKNRIFGKPNNN